MTDKNREKRDRRRWQAPRVLKEQNLDNVKAGLTENTLIGETLGYNPGS